MRDFTKYLIVALVAIVTITVSYSSYMGVGVASFVDPVVLTNARNTNCPDDRRDMYGNCRGNNFRARFGSRDYFDGTGK